MTIRVSDRPCPECGEDLRVIYVSRLEQVVSGWSCPNCGFVESEKQDFRANVPLIEDEEFLIRRLKPFSTADVRDPLGDVESEFQARASDEMDPDEVWMLVDPDGEGLVDVVYGAEYSQSARADDA